MRKLPLMAAAVMFIATQAAVAAPCQPPPGLSSGAWTRRQSSR